MVSNARYVLVAALVLAFAAGFVPASRDRVAHAQTPGQVPAVSQTPQMPAPCPLSSTQITDLIALVNRIGDIVNDAEKRSPAVRSARQSASPNDANDQGAKIKVSGGTANTVGVPREKLDEIRAEVDQLRAILSSK